MLILTQKKYDKEHVTPFIRNHKKFKKLNILNNIDYSNLRLTLDELEDYDNLKKYLDILSLIFFSWKKVVNLVNNNPRFKINSHLLRNEGAKMSIMKKTLKEQKK